MKKLLAAVAALGMLAGAAHAQSVNNTDKPNSPGSTGAMQNSTTNGVATDPNAVKEQQGRSSGSSPGTVGAAPGADTQSQNPAPK